MKKETEIWESYKEKQQKRRRERLPNRQAQVEQLTEKGIVVEKKTEYHYRLNNVLDVWPIHQRYHNLKTNKRGGYKSVIEIERLLKKIKE